MTLDSSVPLVLIFLVVGQIIAFIVWISKFRTQFDEQTKAQKQRGEQLDKERQGRDSEIKSVLSSLASKMDKQIENQSRCQAKLPKEYIGRAEGNDIWKHVNEHEKRISGHGERIAKIEARPCP